ncbi:MULTISPECIES: DedA family protein [Legionella]|uniref:DedA family protein n=1 Tax=Legionella resiliens TaxID=2905958 RepID=A0ABS8X2Y0_9GAMM|nr:MULTISPECIES: DedA family protein [unclassified Legionella]MCE0722966.1 DedA family protein [Legionella sp. 9fVS26]MCE3532119.1 DedA family protein [Legionella sp. 8cVS16]QLZ68247.1 membrane protein [Legionella sp. PC1000]
MLLNTIFDYIIHIDVYLNAIVSNYGFWTYLLLFAVIFCETGLVVTPFLPGDSLLFAAGSIAAQPGNPLNISILLLLLFLASVLGNQINFLIGRLLGPRIFSTDKSWLLNRKHLEETHAFYEKHGGKTIIFARFLPIIRTFAPFVAGIGTMRIVHFSLYNLISALIWIVSLLSLGYFLGSIPLVKENFTVVIYGIIFISILPPLLALLSRKRAYSDE